MASKTFSIGIKLNSQFNDAGFRKLKASINAASAAARKASRSSGSPPRSARPPPRSYTPVPLGPPVTPRSARSRGFPMPSRAEIEASQKFNKWRNHEYTWQRMPEQQQLAKKAGEGRGRSKAEKEAAAEAERRRKEWAKQKVAEIRAARQAPISSATDITAGRAKNFRQEVKDVQRLWKREQNLKKVTELKGEAQKALEGGDLLGATRKQVDAKLMRDATNLYTPPKEDWQATERVKAQREARQTLADMEKAEKAEKNRRKDTRSARKAAQQGDVDKVLEAQARAQSEKVRADRQKTIQALSDDSNQLNLLDTDEAQRKLQTERTKQVELASKRDRHRKAAETLEKRRIHFFLKLIRFLRGYNRGMVMLKVMLIN